MKPIVYKYISVILCLILLPFRQAQGQARKADLQETIKKIQIEVQEATRSLQLNKRLERLDLALQNFDQKFKDEFKDLGEEVKIEIESIDVQVDPEISAETVERSKTFSKSYTVDARDRLAIDNQFGAVNINTWARNEIKIEVEMKAFEDSDSEAKALLDGVHIVESRQSDLISVRTSIERNKNGWWGTTKKNGKEIRRGVQVNYTVYMPSKNPLDITNKYGSISVPDHSGVININSSYGSFAAKSLSNISNRIKVSYGSAKIENLRSGDVEISYGSLDLGVAQRINADVKYSSAKIQRLTENGDFDIKYSGGFRISEVDERLKDLNLNAAYSSVTLGFNPGANFDFDVTVSYAGFKYNNDRVNITSKTPDDNARGFNPSKNFKGTYGRGSDAKVIIRSNFGPVQFQ